MSFGRVPARFRGKPTIHFHFGLKRSWDELGAFAGQLDGDASAGDFTILRRPPPVFDGGDSTLAAATCMV